MTEITPETFDVIATAQGRSYPKDTVTVYMDHEAAHAIYEGEKRIAGEKNDELVNAWDAERASLLKRVKDSAVIFELQGLNQKVIRAIETQTDAKFGEGDTSGVRNIWKNRTLLAAHIARVTNAAGAVDPKPWDAERIGAFEELAPAEEYAKLFGKMSELTFEAAYFEQIEISPDFS